MRAWGKLALVQDPAKGGLLSGGILDMIAVKHTPVRPVAKQQLSPGALKVPADVKLKSVDLTVSLESLSFYLAQGDQ